MLMKNPSMKTHCLLAVLLCVPLAALAQQATPLCPALPSDSGLQWDERVSHDFIACKARSVDGRESLNVMLSSRDPNLRLVRALRAESGTFSGETLYWYIPELAGRDESFVATRRITVAKLGKDQYAQVWINAESPEELGRLQAVASQLDISAARHHLASGK